MLASIMLLTILRSFGRGETWNEVDLIKYETNLNIGLLSNRYI